MPDWKFNQSDLPDISHLHEGEQNRIRAGQYDARELGLLLKGQNPWVKSGKPEPLKRAESSDPKPDEHPVYKGTRVHGQLPSENEDERRRREQNQIEAEVVETMHATHRAKYDDPNTPEDQRNTIFQTYKDKLDERKRREEAEFRKKVARMAEAQDLLHRITSDPDKAHITLPADDSEGALLRWYDDVSQPIRPIPFPDSFVEDIEQQSRKEREPQQEDRRESKAEADEGQPTDEELIAFMSAKTRKTWERSNLTPQERARIWQGNKKLYFAAQRVKADKEIQAITQPAHDGLRHEAAVINIEAPKPPSTAKMVWVFVRKFAALGGAFLLGASWSMLQIDEYGLALLLLVVGMTAFAIQIYDWKGIEDHSRATAVLKSVAAVLILFSLMYFSAVIVKRGEGKAWSTLLERRKTSQAADSAKETGTPKTAPVTGVNETPTPRVLLNKTPRQLLALYEKGNTELQSDQLMGPFKGEWIRVKGTLATLSPTERGVVATIEVKEGKHTDSVGASFIGVGAEARKRFMRFTPGDTITIEGRIAQEQGGVFLYLIEAELIEP